jgi:HTH-type transcriptional regulator / antitoxin HigA
VRYVFTHAEYDKNDWKHNPLYYPESYGALLSKYLPMPIASEDDNERALVVQNLMAIERRSPEENSLLELLVQLIERFEDEHYSFDAASQGDLATPHSILLHLMEERDFKQAGLVGIIGSRGVVSEVVNGKRDISKAQASALSQLFHVDVGLFIGQ